MSEVEPQTIGSHQRTSLLDMSPHQVSQRGMKQVSGSVVLFGGKTSGHIHFGFDDVANLHDTSNTFRLVSRVTGNQRVGVVDQRLRVLALERTGVANLTTGFSVERCFVQKNVSGFASLQLPSWLTFDVNGNNARIEDFKIGVSDKPGFLAARGCNGRSPNLRHPSNWLCLARVALQALH